MSYQSWERANKAHYLAFGTTPLMRHYDYDDQEFCEYCVKEYFRVLFALQKTSPLTKKFCTLDRLIDWFNSEWPLSRAGDDDRDLRRSH